MMKPSEAGAMASFRDPAGRLYNIDGRILRLVSSAGAGDLRAFLDSATAKRFTEAGRLIASHQLAEYPIPPALRDQMRSDEGALVIEHERVAFPSYPYEWPPEMLHRAGELTLDLAESLLAEGLGLKDATPYNVLFRGPEPVFVDVLSAERRDPGDPIWLPAAQFERTFLLPLLVNQRFGIGLDRLLATRRDGLEPEEVYKMTGPLRRLAPPFLSLVSMSAWLGRRGGDASIYQKRILDNPDKARFILESLFGRMRRVLNRLRPRAGARSAWSDYLDANNNYTRAHFEAKQRFVEQSLDEIGAKAVLDIGCNTGHFSALAARRGARVVAIDTDAVVVGETWRRALEERLDILPLVVDLSRPSPAIGWRNRECASFLDRGRGAFDLVMMLAVIHHLMVSERVPLDEIIALAAELTRDAAIIEFVAPDDSMFRRLTRGRDALFAGLSAETFEAACKRRFEITRGQHLEGTSRWLYCLRKK